MSDDQRERLAGCAAGEQSLEIRSVDLPPGVPDQCVLAEAECMRQQQTRFQARIVGDAFQPGSGLAEGLGYGDRHDLCTTVGGAAACEINTIPADRPLIEEAVPRWAGTRARLGRDAAWSAGRSDEFIPPRPA